ncbi:unnamed protein product [Darwinula stevensoni]|uniref:Uncharacterized protein n=1 Tax=Darwinula stevensoni TaxID=69355 RepID=A0A7R8XBY4_9CRUS|nr:unnamed protein product [Darwinula stevensoni]CAG0893265.1 unnamed protein product [Darwinula stevensoni]
MRIWTMPALHVGGGNLVSRVIPASGIIDCQERLTFSHPMYFDLQGLYDKSDQQDVLQRGDEVILGNFFHADSQVATSGMFNNLYLRMVDTDEIHIDPDETGWKIHLHDSTDSPVVDIRTYGFTLFPGWSKDVRIDLRDFKTLDTKRRPCNGSHEYSESKCKAACFVRKVFERANCSLPYMSEVIPTPTCDTKESYAAATKAAKRLLFWGEWNPQDCDCPRQCYNSYYVPFGESVHTGGNQSRLRVYYQDLTFDDVVEEYSYTEIPLLCDIGGTLGLLLGASVLTFVEILEILCGYATTVRRVPVNQPEQPLSTFK